MKEKDITFMEIFRSTGKWILIGAVIPVSVVIIYLIFFSQKQNFTNSIDMKFSWIPPGEFIMGSHPDEPERDNDEAQHKVIITKGFYMLTTEVTNAQWYSVMENIPSVWKQPQRPVEKVSWDDIQVFIKKLNEKEKTSIYRLPTEAEWEYACRAGNSTAWYCGDTDENLGDYAWFNINSGFHTNLVARKLPNAWGLYDMHGNVWEWCSDNYGEYPNETVTDPKGTASGSDKVARGGCWLGSSVHNRSATRLNLGKDRKGNLTGFRIVAEK